ALVDLTVAVVVLAVAGLGRGLHVLVADDAAVLARGGARRADALQAGVARLAALGVALVDLAVAVVVEPVAQLDAGLLVLVADGRHGQSGVGAGRADPLLPGFAARGAAGVALVGLAVAVVVEAVADLGRGQLVRVADEEAAHARGGARRADPEQAGVAR